MIDKSPYIPAQINGDVINAFFMALEEEFSDAKTICDYLYNLTFNTAQTDELDTIGDIVGYPRPLVPQSLMENWFLFLDNNQEGQQKDVIISPDNGFANIEGDVGGKFYSINYGKENSNYMQDGLYSLFLKRIALLKRYGLTLKTIDFIASVFSTNYTLSFDENADIKISYLTRLGFQNVWVITKLFERIQTIPAVILQTIS